MNDRTDVVFVTAALVLIAGVPVALYTIYYFAESIHHIAVLALLVIIVVSILGVTIVRYKNYILSHLKNKTTQFVRDISRPLSESIENFVDGKTHDGSERLEEFIRSLATHYTWIHTRRWIMTIATALLLGFAGLVGSALLKKQNDLIARQNEYFREQNEQQNRLINLQQQVSNQTIRSEAIRRIYGPDYAKTPRVKAEAVRSLVTVERVRIAQGVNTLPTDYINLHDADLSGAWLDSADLDRISFRGSRLNRANLNSSELNGSVFRFTDLTGTTFIGASTIGMIVAYSSAEGAVFSDASMSNVLFSNTNLSKSTFRDADLSQASFVNVNLENADLQGLRNWKSIESVRGSNIFGIRNAPDGFEMWAIENGAISEEGALSNLWKDALDARAEEETTN